MRIAFIGSLDAEAEAIKKALDGDVFEVEVNQFENARDFNLRFNGLPKMDLVIIEEIYTIETAARSIGRLIGNTPVIVLRDPKVRIIQKEANLDNLLSGAEELLVGKFKQK